MVIRLEPNDDIAYNDRGVQKANLGHHEAAIYDYDEAIRINSDNADAYFNRGFAKKILGRNAEADQDFQKALSLAQDEGDEKLIDRIKKQM